MGEKRGFTHFPLQIPIFQVYGFYSQNCSLVLRKNYGRCAIFWSSSPEPLGILIYEASIGTKNSFFAVQPRSMDPSKDLAAYGYGSVAWKERMESWKQKQEKMHARNDNGGKDWDNDGDGPDLPLWAPEASLISDNLMNHFEIS